MTDDEIVDIIAMASLKATISWARRTGQPVPRDLEREWDKVPDHQKTFAIEQARETISIIRSRGFEITVEKKS